MRLTKMVVRREHRKVRGVCRYPGCSDTFCAPRQRIYCDYHSNPKHRARKDYNHNGGENQIIDHSFRVPTQIIMRCGLPGCRELLALTVTPGDTLYPRYCEGHRTVHRREHFLRQQGNRVEAVGV